MNIQVLTFRVKPLPLDDRTHSSKSNTDSYQIIASDNQLSFGTLPFYIIIMNWSNKNWIPISISWVVHPFLPSRCQWQQTHAHSASQTHPREVSPYVHIQYLIEQLCRSFSSQKQKM